MKCRGKNYQYFIKQTRTPNEKGLFKTKVIRTNLG